MPGKAIIVSAPSGAGKTTIVHALLESGLALEFSVSACSRPMRENETEGRDYYFMTADQFRQKIHDGEFIEWEEVYPDQFYGTLKTEAERIWNKGKHIIFDVDVQGGMNLKRILGDGALSLFIMPPSLEALEERLRSRSTDDEASIRKRVGKAGMEMEQAVHFDRIVINDQLQVAINEAVTLCKDFLS